MTAPIDVATVIEAGQHVLATLRSQLHEPSATARAAESRATDALSAFELGINMLTYETKRQATVAASRKSAAAERLATDKAKAVETDRQRNIRQMELDSQRQRRLKQAQDAAKHAAAQK